MHTVITGDQPEGDRVFALREVVCGCEWRRLSLPLHPILTDDGRGLDPMELRPQW